MGILFPEVRTTSVRLIWQSPSQPNGIVLGGCALLLSPRSPLEVFTPVDEQTASIFTALELF